MGRWIFVFAFVPCLVGAQEHYPLEPLDTSSPRGTLTSFLESANAAILHWQRHVDGSQEINLERAANNCIGGRLDFLRLRS